MKLIRILLFVALLILPAFSKDTKGNTDVRERKALKYIAGTSLLAIEFIGIPIADIYLNYKKFPKIRNPLKYLLEKEPYIEDELWHFVGASMFTEINFRILENLFGLEDPYLLSGIMTIMFWTGMECFDGLSGSGFSLRDEGGNLLGVTFSLIKIAYPELPLKIRIGVKDWGALFHHASDIFSGSIKHSLGKQYSYMKVEVICFLFETFIYTGVAVSRDDKKNDLYGITTGLDFIDWINESTNGWWNKPVGFINRYFSLSLNFTWWIKE